MSRVTSYSIQTLLILCLITLSQLSMAQMSGESNLYKVLKAKDSLLFEIGFNQCNLAQIEALLHEDFEFFHDRDGMINSTDDFLSELNQNICSSGNALFKRALEPGSLQVFPLSKDGELYGAIQTGVHRFGNTVAKFTHLWLKKDGDWYGSKMMSYDHQTEETKVNTDLPFIKLSIGDLATYLGKYEFSPEFVLTMVVEGNKMYGDAHGQKIEVKTCGAHRFLDVDRTTELYFTLGKDGKAIALTMTTPEGQMNAKKTN